MQIIQSVDRALQLLETVGESVKPVSLGELTSVLGIDRSSVFRLAQTLRRRGYLIQLRDSKHYTLGSAIWRLSRRLRWPDVVGPLAETRLSNWPRRWERRHIWRCARKGRSFSSNSSLRVGLWAFLSDQPGRAAPLHGAGQGAACGLRSR